jgi:hypothetical protein
MNRTLWLRTLRRWLSSRPTCRRRTARPVLELLEDRWLPAPVTVTSTADAVNHAGMNYAQMQTFQQNHPADQTVTLLDAINAANLSPERWQQHVHDHPGGGDHLHPDPGRQQPDQ